MSYLPPASEVCEGNVFTGVCLSMGEVSVSVQGGLCPLGVSVQGVSVRGGGLCPGGSLSKEKKVGKELAVRILLKSILVELIICCFLPKIYLCSLLVKIIYII